MIPPRPMVRLVSVLAVVSIVGCIDLDTQDDRVTTIWNAELSAEPQYAPLTGKAAVLSQADGTVATILLETGEPGTSYAWGVWLGTCEIPEGQIGPDSDYPELVVDDAGEATRTTNLGPRLSLDNTYHVQVQLTDTADRTRVACGDLAGEQTS